MKNLLKNKRLITFLCILGILLCAVPIIANPGSSSDPLISLSYFDDKIEELKESLLSSLSETLSTKFNEFEKESTKKLEELKDQETSTASTFELITLGANETIICEANTQIIVRSGKSVIVTSESSTGGISDLTLGKDLVNGEQISNNHLLIVPKGDGRGIKATITGAVMINGKYTKQTKN